jgi:hypothetical protein
MPCAFGCAFFIEHLLPGSSHRTIAASTKSGEHHCHNLMKPCPRLTTQLPQIATIVKPFRSFLATAAEKYAATIERQLPAHAWWRPVAANLLPAMPSHTHVSPRSPAAPRR